MFEKRNNSLVGILFFFTWLLHINFVSSDNYDNSDDIPNNITDYVEGKSRYIIMPDSNGNLINVDLFPKVPQKEIIWSNKKDYNKYYLYTRMNPTTPQELELENKDLLQQSYFDGSLPLKVVIHGWTWNITAPINGAVRPALLQVGDVNVIVLDWGVLASYTYPVSCKYVKFAGEWLGKFLVWLVNTTGGTLDRVHIIGHSLGAHLAGQAGLYLKGKADRITGLDPAGPLWLGSENPLSFKRARYVECIHTDSGYLGISRALCDVDFYVNGGSRVQPGCPKSNEGCSHGRAVDLYASSILYNKFVGHKCDELKHARDNNYKKPKCKGCSMMMGNDKPEKFGSGIFSIETDSVTPYHKESRLSQSKCP